MSRFLESFPDGSILGDTDYDKVILTYMGEKYECANKKQAIRKMELLKKKRYHAEHREQDNARAKEYRETHREEVRKMQKEYKLKNKERLKPIHREQEKKYRGKWPKKILAHKAVQTAIMKGAFKKQPCEICGETKSEAHHDDYDKPLEVRWLCKACHTEWHMHNKAKGVE